MSKSEWEEWFERVWAHREETIYPELFGPISRGIFPLTLDLFESTFEQPCDPRWLHHGVFEFAPTSTRPSWLYVTSGMSNAWEDESPDPEGPSGLGCEFIFETVGQGDWAIQRLQHLMACQILTCHGRYRRKEPLGLFDRIALHVPLTDGSSLTRLMLVEPENLPAGFALESGSVDLYLAVGITEREAAFAREVGDSDLVERLKARGAVPVTDPTRSCVIGGSAA